jgi:dTDP-4-dehydrorhamnose 3,5-epimerase
MDTMIEGVALIPLKIIPGENGAVMHGLKVQEDSYKSFGEAYFSFVNKGKIKGWKRHTKMTLNLIVPVGNIRFVLYDDRDNSKTKGSFNDVCLGPEIQYSRLTIPPGIWMAFQGMGNEQNLLLNIADIPHDPSEAEQLQIENSRIPNFKWQ